MLTVATAITVALEHVGFITPNLHTLNALHRFIVRVQCIFGRVVVAAVTVTTLEHAVFKVAIVITCHGRAHLVILIVLIILAISIVLLILVVILIAAIHIRDRAGFGGHARVVVNTQRAGQHGSTSRGVKRINVRFLVAHADRCRGAA